jgi:hypothetical protein
VGIGKSHFVEKDEGSKRRKGMIWITLKDGTELRYNAANRGRVEDGFYKMGTKVPVQNNMVA